MGKIAGYAVEGLILGVLFVLAIPVALLLRLADIPMELWDKLTGDDLPYEEVYR